MFFAGWDLPEFDKLVEHVAHGTALDLLDAVREELEDTFTAYAKDGEWNFEPQWEGHHETHLSWVPIKHEGMWEGGFPVEIMLTPDAFAAAFKAGLKAHEGHDGTLTTDSREDLLESLAEWRWAIDQAEAALKEHP
jgi:hypothetical protein